MLLPNVPSKLTTLTSDLDCNDAVQANSSIILRPCRGSAFNSLMRIINGALIKTIAIAGVNQFFCQLLRRYTQLPPNYLSMN